MIPYINLAAGALCICLAVVEFARLENTRQWNLFWDLVLAGINFYFAARGFGWL